MLPLIPLLAITCDQIAAQPDITGDWECAFIRYTKLHIISLGGDRYSVASHCEECFGDRDDRHFAHMKNGVLKLDGPLEEDTEYDTDTYIVKTLPAGTFLLRSTQKDSWPDDIERIKSKDWHQAVLAFAHSFTRPGLRNAILTRSGMPASTP